LLTLSVFVAEDPPDGEAARAVKAAQAVAARFPGVVEVEVLPLGGGRAEDLGLRLSPTVVEGDMVLAVGEAPSAGRLKRYIQARLAEDD
jgi:hypothetical protein